MKVSRKLSLFLALSFVSITILFFNYFPRYAVISPNLIKNPDFDLSDAEWRINEKKQVSFDGNGIIRLTVEPGDPPVMISQTINLPPHSLVQLTCDFKVEGVVMGDESWHTARVILISLDHEGKELYNRPHNVVHQSGSSDWSSETGVFMTDEDIDNVQIALQLTARQGTMYVKSLKLQQILLKPEFAKIRQWLLITWIIFGLLAVVVLVVGYIKNKQQALAGFLISLIWIGILLPARIKYKIAHNAFIGHGSAGHHYMMARPESQMFSFVLSPPEWDIFKLGHFILFGILACLLSSRNTYHLKPLHNLGLLAILALLTEIGQLFIPGRTPTLTDIFIDLSGAGVGLMIKACLINFSNRSTGQNA